MISFPVVSVILFALVLAAVMGWGFYVLRINYRIIRLWQQSSREHKINADRVFDESLQLMALVKEYIDIVHQNNQ